ncbi:hypothetical protein ABZW03_25130, partial [Kitasatospora sp. NPDC004799]|uniref:hypothetical protein n=1 Tax=Kitasatospora sp. NPDC004799 TaxID=3154460 RepID=UPI0033BAB5EC
EPYTGALARVSTQYWPPFDGGVVGVVGVVGGGGPEPHGGGAGAVALLPAPGRATTPGHARATGGRSVPGLRFGRAAACTSSVARTGLHRCRGVRRAGRGGHRAH